MEESKCLRWGRPAGAVVCAPPCQVLPLLRERPAAGPRMHPAPAVSLVLT